MRQLAVPLFLLASACAGGPPPNGQGEGPLAEVYRELKAYYTDLSARDWSRFAGHFWPGATLTTVWAPKGETAPRVVACTVPEFVALAPEGPGSKAIFEEQMEYGSVRIENDLAQVWSYYTMKFGDPGDVQTTRGVDSITLLRHGGSWKITSIAYTGRQ
jgi:hypothetical protein